MWRDDKVVVIRPLEVSVPLVLVIMGLVTCVIASELIGDRVWGCVGFRGGWGFIGPQVPGLYSIS